MTINKQLLILITSGTGYVGSILIRKLLLDNFRIAYIDKLNFTGDFLVGVWGRPGFEFRRIDITNFADVDKIIEASEFSAIIYLVSLVGDLACKLEPELAVKTNKGASIYLLNKAVERKIERFIFASTCSNYEKMDSSEEYVDETSQLSPVSLYAELKMEVENYLLHEIDKREGFYPAVLRFAAVFSVSI